MCFSQENYILQQRLFHRETNSLTICHVSLDKSFPSNKLSFTKKKTKISRQRTLSKLWIIIKTIFFSARDSLDPKILFLHVISLQIYLFSVTLYSQIFLSPATYHPKKYFLSTMHHFPKSFSSATCHHNNFS